MGVYCAYCRLTPPSYGKKQGMSEGPKLSEDAKDTYQKRQDVAQVGQTDYAKKILA